MTSELSIGIDLGATKIAAALVNSGGEVLDMDVLPTLPERGEDAVLDDIARLISRLRESALKEPGLLRGVGVGSPGQIDAVRGVIHNAVNLGWVSVSLVERLGERLKGELPIWLQKDANAAALGEYYFGSACHEQDFLYISIGSGLGGSAFSAGRLILGAQGSAAEVGHISLDPDSKRLCECGQPGCAETIVSGPGLCTLVRELLQERGGSALINADSSPADIVSAARQGDETALDAIETMGRHLGILISHAATWFNPGVIVLGGGLGLAVFDLIVPSCLAEARKRTYRGSMGFRMAPSSLKSSAVGAASLVWYSLNGGVAR